MPSQNKSPDYQSIIDAETWSFIREVAGYYPENTVSFSVHDQRRVYDTMCRAFHAGHPDNVSTENDACAEIPVRIYTPTASPTDMTIIYFHGGGYILGGLESHDDVCSELAGKTGIRLVSVDYRLAPEHKHPAAFEDAFNAAKTIQTNFGGNLILCGDSAGGNLAAAVSHAARTDELQICGQVLIYPDLGSGLDTLSSLTHANAPMLTREDMVFYQQVRVEGNIPENDPTFAPLNDTNFSDLPQTIAFAAQCDPLADDCRLYCDKINSSGGKARWHMEKGLIHGYLRARHSVARARTAFANIVSAIKEIAASDRN